MQSDINQLLAMPDLGLDPPGGGSSAVSADSTAAVVGSDATSSDPLAVTTQPPGGVTAGSGFSMVVTAENTNGSVNAAFNGSVTVSSPITDLSGQTTVTAVNGVATFTGLTIDTAGGNFLTVSAAGMPSASTGTFMVDAAAATQLVLSIPNGNVVAGGAFSLPAIAEDQFGNVDASFSGNVTLSLSSNVAGATLGGTLTVAASGGIASFSGLTLDKLGSGYTLQATSSGLSSGVSSPFDVTDHSS